MIISSIKNSIMALKLKVLRWNFRHKISKWYFVATLDKVLLSSSPDESLRLFRLVVPHKRLVGELEDGESVDGHVGGGLAPKFPPEVNTFKLESFSEGKILVNKS